LFIPSACKRSTQCFCAKAACRKASKAHSQRQWQRKNPDYFKGPEHAERVRRWRASHPGYSRGRKRRKTEAALQDSAPAQVTQPQPLAEAAQPSPSDFLQREAAPASCNAPALQDLASVQVPLLAGLVSTVMGSALQENFAALTRELVERGRRVLARDHSGSGRMHAFEPSS
jgi:hypothetical protein